MKKVKTDDGSETFYSEEYEQTYHSTSGAMDESFRKFIEPCKVKDGMTILDICFGLGYNTLAALKTAKNLKIIALEKDQKMLDEIKTLKIPEELKKEFEIIKIVAEKHHYKDENYEITLLLGDARETIKKVEEEFDAIFLDPFSPPKNPELWTEEFFTEIKKRMKPQAILATYSCARKVRDNLKSVGLKIEDGPSVGRRAPSTLATNS